ncbi:MAG: hypothetical protein IPI66_01630 [Chitinophagaceae bacterium]|nr:hypothetical protein [Chitinophagaceae bacterium]MBL0054884.1 hypothetical protein [Chitinophagaceae bacterium]
MKTIGTTLLALLFFQTGLWAQNNSGNNKPARWITHTDTEYQFSFQYPDNWEFKLPGTNTRFFVTSYPENTSDGFRENVNCIARKLTQKTFQVKDAEEEILKSLREKLSDFALLSVSYPRWNNTQVMLLEYTCSMELDQEKIDVRMMQQLAFVKGTLYTFTFTAEQKNYDAYLPAVKKMLTSFVVK